MKINIGDITLPFIIIVILDYGHTRDPMGLRTYYALQAKRYYDPYDQSEVWSINNDAKDSYYEGQAKVSSHKRLTYLWEATVLKVVKVLVHP